ncbi:MAG: tRNA (N6-isopentenyl adenosine(37)-C2)-methylthiotransferase MiaB [Verrucomicrobiia bacterium]
MKKVFIKTYGCQMNERDSEAVAAMLQARGYAITDSENDADVILLNTCSIRDLAEQKALGKMRLLANLKRQNPDLVLGFIGCMAQSRGERLLKEQPAVDLVVGTQKFHRVPEYLDRLIARPTVTGSANRGREAAPTTTAAIVDVAEEPGSESAICDHVLETADGRQVTAYVSIMQGCDMHCTFCIVPSVRGEERSRPIPEIVEEVEHLVAAGVKEVTLLGQIVTGYGRKTMAKKGGKTPFVQLLEAVHEVKGLERIRFTSPHPKGFGDDLVAAYRDLPKVCEHAHLPVQSGSTRILKLMGRGYSREWYLRIVEKLRAVKPQIGITTDVIVGFPGETEEDFEQTASLMREVHFDQAYIFKYSPRRDTEAAGTTDHLSDEVKEMRHQILLDALNKSMLEQNQRLVGETMEVLVEGRSYKNPKRLAGRTRNNRIVMFEGTAELIGQLLPIRIERVTVVTLYGNIVNDNHSIAGGVRPRSAFAKASAFAEATADKSANVEPRKGICVA